MRARMLVALTACAIGTLAVVSAQQFSQRDNPVTPTTGTSSVSGQVVLDESTPQPVRRARVSVASVEGTVTKWTVTDAAGNFTVPDLPAGRYNVTAAKTGLVRATYGARRFDRPGTPVSVGENQKATGLVLKMMRGGVIAGTIRDEQGQPAVGAIVRALQFRNLNGDRTLTSTSNGLGDASDTTDDRGNYRIFGLNPGDYVISMTPRESGRNDLQQMTDAALKSAQQMLSSSATGGQPVRQLSPSTTMAQTTTSSDPMVRGADGPTVGYTALYYPGTGSPTDAQLITINAGEERNGVDLQIRLIRTAKVEGNVMTPAGVSPQSVQLLLVPGGQGQPATLASMSLTIVSPDANGKFSFSGVTPGVYTVSARASSGGDSGGPGPGGPGGGGRGAGMVGGAPGGGGMPMMAIGGGNQNLWATAEVSVDGENISGVSLSLQPGMTISGKLAFEGTRTEPAGDLSRAMVMLMPGGGSGGRVMMMGGGMGPGRGPVDATGKFTLTGIIPGKYRLQAGFSSPEANYSVKSAIFKGKDALDFPLEVLPNEDISNALITFTDQTQSVTGRLSDAQNRPATDFTIVVFPSDKNLWGASRRIRTNRPSTDGKFTIADLPSGEYRIAALADIAPGEQNDPSFLEQLVAASVAISVKDGEVKVQDLRVRSGG